ncbi:MAG: aldo/keto reductase [Clostridiales Family XIII bacterium]|jgi:predicted aldo/keto reductase-like oxidoreductase|nr:aldo/keto reductase [Clostridiales Family XIII bacterium]
MNYRTFQLTGEKISLLGFGAMRLPVIDGDHTRVDEQEAIAMIRKAIDSGVNYVDTGFPYHGGKSEVAVGKALKDGYREKVLLADKFPLFSAKSPEDVDSLFEKQMERLDTDFIDMYLLHNINKAHLKVMKACNVLPQIEKKRDEGRIKHIGFSFHDELPLFKEVIDSYPWAFCQIQLNYMDVNFQAGLEGLKYAASKGIPVVIMEPLKGGKLTDSVPDEIQRLWDGAAVKRSPAEWAFRWVADFPEVLTILSGMSTMEQLDENLSILSAAEASSLTIDEKALIKDVSDAYNRITPYSCTSCRYCMPCASGVNIPESIQFRNDWEVYNHNDKLTDNFNMFFPRTERPSNCVECGQCEEKCPQSLSIIKALSETTVIFEQAS